MSRPDELESPQGDSESAVLAAATMKSMAPALAAPSEGIGQSEAGSISVHYTTKKLQRRHMWGLALVTLSFTAIWTAVPSIMLPNQVQLLEFARFFTGSDSSVDLQELTQLKDAVQAGTQVATVEQQRLLGLLAQFEAARATSLALVSTIATIATLLTQPLIGEFSDRTRSRLGRRAPWILYGGLIGALALCLLSFAPSIAVIVVLYAIVNAATSAANTPLITTIVDREPEGRVGSASSMLGFGNFMGGIIGSIAAGALFSSIGLGFYFVLAMGLALAVTLFVIQVKDKSSKDMVVAPFAFGAFIRGFLVPLRTPDFRWVWIARVLLLFGFGVSSSLSLYMMQSYIQPALSQAEATAIAPLLGLVGLPLTIVALLVFGRLSDKIGRRKPFVIGASLLMAASFAVPLISPTLPGLFIQAILGTFAFGVFLPVDQALFVDVLPDKLSAGRDLGIAGMATNVGQALAPLVAAQVVATTAGYAGVWVVALVLVALAAVCILRVKSAR